VHLFRSKFVHNKNHKFNGSALLLIVLVVAGFAIRPRAQAVVPAPDGGYPGGNTAEGQNALLGLTTGGYNTAIGFLSLASNTTGPFNTAVGAGTLLVNTTGDNNTATGAGALLSNTGSGNTANGAFALFSNATGGQNTAIGDHALEGNTTGLDSTAVGYFALVTSNGNGNTAVGFHTLLSNGVGAENTAVGDGALFGNVTGSENTAVGHGALVANTVDGNTAVGSGALNGNTSGTSNVAVGRSALLVNTSGVSNTAVGNGALVSNTGDDNTAIGAGALLSNTTGNFNTALGQSAASNVTGDNNIDIGFNVNGVAGESNTIRIGNTNITDTFIRGISGATASGGAAVFVNSNGKLGTLTSSARFKEEIKPIGRASEVILALRPVSFRYKREIDPQSIAQFGLVAEEVEKISPDLVIRGADGKSQTVRYEQINAMLLNEFLKAHRTVQELKTTVEHQQKQIEALTAGLQKMSDRIETNKTMPKIVLNKP
jgi:trimeric autotransporter adhesin